MNPALVAVAVAVVAGCVVAVSARDARAAVLGLGLGLVAAPILADPMSDPVGLAGRLVGAILAAYLLWIAVRGSRSLTGGSRIGWPAEGLLAAAAAVVGYGTHGLGAQGVGPPEAQAASFALATLAIAPIATGRDIVRIGLGLIVLATAALLLRVALSGTPTAMEQLVTAGLVGALGGAVALLAGAARRDGPGGFDLADERHPHASRATDVRSVRIPRERSTR